MYENCWASSQINKQNFDSDLGQIIINVYNNFDSDIEREFCCVIIEYK